MTGILTRPDHDIMPCVIVSHVSHGACLPVLRVSLEVWELYPMGGTMQPHVEIMDPEVNHI